MTLEEELRAALQSQADSIEPGDASFVQLVAKVGSTEPAASRRRSDRARFLAAAAAVVVVLGGIGVVVRGSNQDRDTVAAQPGVVEAVDQTTVPGSDANTDPIVAPKEAPALQGFIAGPIRATREEAAAAFLKLVGIEAADLVLVENAVEVHTAHEDGSLGPVVSTLTIARVESNDGYSVTEATTPRVIIDSPVAPDSSGYVQVETNEVPITGSGTGFEATLGVEVISSIDGTLLDNGGVVAGNFGELAPFSDTVQVFGEGRAWIVIRSAGGADNVTEPFAAVPISYDTPLHPAVYTVVGIADDDPDGGLNVRNLPGPPDARVPDEAEEAEVSDASVSDEAEEAEVSDASVSVVGVLPLGTTDVHIRSLVPAIVGSETWWNIEVGEIEGWVNSRYLNDEAAEIDSERRVALEQLALSFNTVMVADGVGAETLPWTSNGVVRVGYVHNLLEVSAPTAATADYWAAEREILREGMAGQDGLVTSLADFIKPFPDAPIDVSFNAVSPYALDQEALGELGQGVDVVTIGYATDDYAFQNIHLYVEDSAEGPVIVAVAVVIWVP